MRSDDALFIDIIEHARFVRDTTMHLTREAFIADKVVHLAVTHALQIIGEASRMLPQTARDRFPMVPWTQIVGMRHRLVHEYFRVDLERVWDSATADVTALLVVLEPVMQPVIDAHRAAGGEEKQKP